MTVQYDWERRLHGTNSTAGLFEKIWSKGLEQYDELEGIGWEWQSLDGCMIKAPLALESVGKNPTDRGKKGTKRSALVDEKELPLAIVISGANTHDIKLLEETLDHIVVLRPEPDGMAFRSFRYLDMKKRRRLFLNLRRWLGRRNGRCLADIARFLYCCSLVCAAPFSAALEKH